MSIQTLKKLVEGQEVQPVEVKFYGRDCVANGVPAWVDAYDCLDLCDNVESEGKGSFRFENVNDKKELERRLKMGEEEAKKFAAQREEELNKE